MSHDRACQPVLGEGDGDDRLAPGITESQLSSRLSFLARQSINSCDNSAYRAGHVPLARQRSVDLKEALGWSWFCGSSNKNAKANVVDSSNFSNVDHHVPAHVPCLVWHSQTHAMCKHRDGTMPAAQTNCSGCPAATLDRRQCAMPARRVLLRKCVESRRCCVRQEKRRKRSDMERPFDRWSTRRTEDLAVKAPSCCETW